MFVSQRVLACVLLALPAAAQSPAFEVVSIKLNTTNDPRNMRMQVLPGGRLMATSLPLRLLLSYAYDVPVNPSERMTGVPEWTVHEMYDVEAKAPEGAVPAGLPANELRSRMQAMIRTLLADQFKLVVRTTTRDMPVYALTLAPGGPKMQKAEIDEKGCSADPGDPASCHGFTGGMGRGMHGKAVNMSDVARFIENWTDHPVIDRTGLDGLFAVDTEGWVPMRLPPPPPGGAPNPSARPSGDGDMSDPDRPTLFVILRKLGLDLKQHRGPVQTYVVEHIDHASAN